MSTSTTIIPVDLSPPPGDYDTIFIALLITSFVLAFILSFGIGANDCANSFGTSVGSKALTLFQACCLATVFEVLGCVLMGYKVANTVRKGIFDPVKLGADPVGLSLIFISSLIGAGIWLFIATLLSMPVSGTHSIVGAIFGSVVVHHADTIDVMKMVEVVSAWVFSPVLAGGMSCIFYYVVYHAIIKSPNPLSFGLVLLPIFYFLTIFVNIYAVCSSPPRYFHIPTPPAWLAILISIFIAGACGLLVKILVVPWVENHMIEKMLQLDAQKAETATVGTMPFMANNGDPMYLRDNERIMRPPSESRNSRANTVATTMTPSILNSDVVSPEGTVEQHSSLLNVMISNNAGASETPTSGPPPARDAKKSILRDSMRSADTPTPGAPPPRDAKKSILRDSMRSAETPTSGAPPARDAKKSILRDSMRSALSMEYKPALKQDSPMSVQWHLYKSPMSSPVKTRDDQEDSPIASSSISKLTAGSGTDVKSTRFQMNDSVVLLREIPERSEAGDSPKTVAREPPRRSWVPSVASFMNATFRQKPRTSSTNSITDIDRRAVDDLPEVRILFRFLQILAACFASFAHGGNDVSNSVSPLIALVIINQHCWMPPHATTPWYTLLYGGFGISVGLWVLGRRVMETIGRSLSKITPSSGFCIEIGTACTVLLASWFALPVSTTHCKVGAVICVGRFKSKKNVDWRLFMNIVLAWFVTFPVTIGISALTVLILDAALSKYINTDPCGYMNATNSSAIRANGSRSNYVI